ncbi:MAG: tetratricopeptide repeat protein [Deltaproteobacteria bacterium]|nr:tetratricopeptide repeat protein [Deltaproteobacteria bacterium]
MPLRHPLPCRWSLLAGLVLAWCAPAAAQDDFSEESIATYQAGMDAFNAGNLERAIELFRESYEVHHGHPNALYNIGQCYERLGSFEQSIGYYEQYLATELAEGRDEVYAHIRELRGRRAVFTLRSDPPGARVAVTDANGIPLPEYGELRTPCELELPPGTFVLHFEAEGRTTRTQVVDGGLGRRAVIEVALPAVGAIPPPPGNGTDEPFEVGRIFLGLSGGPVVHLNGSEDPFANFGFGFHGGYTLFDGDVRFDVGAELSLLAYQLSAGTGHNAEDYVSWFVLGSVVPALRWVALDQLHLVVSLALGIGAYVPPNLEITIPWAGNRLNGAMTIIHFRPAVALEYLPLPWLGIVATPVAFDLDIPYSVDGSTTTSVLVRYNAFLGVDFHF